MAKPLNEQEKKDLLRNYIQVNDIKDLQVSKRAGFRIKPFLNRIQGMENVITSAVSNLNSFSV